jgi:MFS family permease
VFVLIALPETRVQGKRSPEHRASLRDVFSGSQLLRQLVTTTLLYCIAFSLMEQSVGLFIEQHWAPTSSLTPMEDATRRTSLFLVVVGASATFFQGFLVRRLLKTKPERLLVQVGLSAIGVSLLAIPLSGEIGLFPVFLLTGVPLALGSALFNPSIAGLVSLASPEQRQGFGLAVNQSAAALGRIIGPTAAGALFSINHNVPLLAGALLSMFALVMFRRSLVSQSGSY